MGLLQPLAQPKPSLCGNVNSVNVHSSSPGPARKALTVALVHAVDENRASSAWERGCVNVSQLP
jgi:hypothetical protein